MTVAAPEKVKAWAGARPEVRARARWELIARPKQLEPEGIWALWLILAGRGWGKTRCGAEWIADKARRYPGARCALVSQTFSDGRDTMVEGESGLLSVLDEGELRGGNRDEAWNRSMGELYLANGSRFKVFSSEKPHRLRGPQHHFGWGDEPATWFDARKGPVEDTTWSNLEIGCRLSIDGSEPQVVLTGTPKPVRLLTESAREPLGLLQRASTVITRGHTDENLPNLAGSYRERVVEPLRGTRLGRQELAAEILTEAEGALWMRAWIDRARVPEIPPVAKGLRTAVLGLDPSDGKPGSDEQGMVLAGKGGDHELYVTFAKAMRTTPREWLREAVTVAHEHDALMVFEANHGGEFVTGLAEEVMREMGLRVPYKTVHATQGKRTRAERPAMLYEQDPPKVHHVGDVGPSGPQLEDEMCGFTGKPGELSPNLMDACLVAGTLVETARGQVPIEDVRVGDLAMTRVGWRRVCRAEQTGDREPVRTVMTGDGRALRGTGNHPVWVDGYGWRPLDSLVWGDTLCLRTTESRSGSNSRVSSSPDGPTPPTAISAATTRRHRGTSGSNYTAKSGRRRTGRSRKGTSSTTSTETRSTTISPTWSASRRWNMRVFIATIQAGWNNFARWLRSARRPPVSGMAPKRVAAGTPRTPSGCGLERSRPRSSASNAASGPSVISSPEALSDSARHGVVAEPLIESAATNGRSLVLSAANPSGRASTARSLGIAPASAQPRRASGLQTLRGRVPRAARPSSHTTAPSRLARGVVLGSFASGEAPVYNLEVEGQPEYFANGVLVHNCVWALHELMSRARGPVKTGAGAVPYTDRSNGRGAVNYR